MTLSSANGRPAWPLTVSCLAAQPLAICIAFALTLLSVLLAARPLAFYSGLAADASCLAVQTQFCIYIAGQPLELGHIAAQPLMRHHGGPASDVASQPLIVGAANQLIASSSHPQLFWLICLRLN